MTSVESRGLTGALAAQKLETVGPNSLDATKRPHVFVRVVKSLAHPLAAILLTAAVVSGLLGDLINAGVIGAMLILSAALEAVQTNRSERAVDLLRAQVANTASVNRDGVYREIPRGEVVPGDLVRLVAGDLVPADARLVTAKDLHVNEAALTGESLPSEKHCGEPGDASLVFAGTSIVSGVAEAVVTETGPRSRFADIAKQLRRKAPPTEFERGTAAFGVFVLKTILFLVLFVFVAAAWTHKGVLESLLFAVALAVGLTPEFLPMITTITLGRAAVRMSAHKVIVKNLASIQNLGSIDVLCSDKTGTLTEGSMALERIVDPEGAEAERPLLLASVNSYFESGVDDPMDTAVLQKLKIDPLDAAVLRHAHPDLRGFQKADEMPFDFERRRVSVVAVRGDERLLITKGAPEHVLEVCSLVSTKSGDVALDAAWRATAQATFAALSKEGFRVLGVASARVSEKPAYDKSDEKDLILAGFLAFADPARKDAKEVIAELRVEGVRVKMISGDNELVVAHVGASVGLGDGPVLTGKEIDGLTDPALAQRAEVTDLFARVSPAQKTRILLALRSRGHVVGFLGDGINDAPSLHAADVGISVSSAVDVAKEAADVILLEAGLSVLLQGIREGRRAFGNVMKYLLMGTSSAFGNMFSMAGAALVLPFLPMLPTQILLNNFLYDLAQVTIPTDRVDASFIKKPRRWDIAAIKRFMLWIGPISSVWDFLTFYVLIHFFQADERMFHTGWFVESLATQALVLFVIRTFGSPWKSRPSRALAATTLAVVLVGALLPYSPLAGPLGFVAMPARYFAFLVPMTLAYLGLVEVVKRRLAKRLALVD